MLKNGRAFGKNYFDELLEQIREIRASEITDMNIATNSNMYKVFATYYDQFYQSKNYEKECAFLHTLLSKYHVKTVLDVGCGTGTHLSVLEQCGYSCEGIDFNNAMLEIAKKKLYGKVAEGDMRNFELNKSYDAITSLFAVFNHNLTFDDAKKTLFKLKSHLKKDGILILDLYNPSSSGKKSNSLGEITKVMEWDLNNLDKICQSTVSFFRGDEKLCEEEFPLKIYSISDMQRLLTEVGFTEIQVYNNFEFEPVDPSSKNLVFVVQ